MTLLRNFFSREHGLAIGEPAPALAAIDQDGVIVDLARRYARGPVFIYFYVRANTPICTAHACRLRDDFADFNFEGVQIFGVSSDRPERLKAFQTRHRLPFGLLSDSESAIAAAFRVPSLLGFTARDAYLVRNGVIAWKGHASARAESVFQDSRHAFSSRESAPLWHTSNSD